MVVVHNLLPVGAGATQPGGGGLFSTQPAAGGGLLPMHCKYQAGSLYVTSDHTQTPVWCRSDVRSRRDARRAAKGAGVHGCVSEHTTLKLDAKPC